MKKSLVFILSMSLIMTIMAGSVFADNSSKNSTSIIPEKLLHESKKFREQLGFDFSDQIIVDLYNGVDKESTLKFGSVLLSNEEFAEINQRIKIIEDATKIKKDIIQGNFSNFFGGMYFDHQKNGGNLRIALVGEDDSTALRNELLNKLPYKEKIEFYYVDYSQKHLKDIQEDLSQYDKVLDYKVYDSTFSPKENKIKIYITPDQINVIPVIIEKYGEHYFIFDISENNRVVNFSRTSAYTPVWGGLELKNQNRPDKYCTSGFSAKKPNGHQFLITAAHCGELGDPYKQGGNNIGTVVEHYYSFWYLDALAIQIRPDDEIPASNKIYDDSSNNIGNELYIDDWSRDIDDEIVGTPVCQSGVTTGVNCGTITGISFYGLLKANVYADGGDSGAPLYTPYYLFGTAHLKGILRGPVDGVIGFSHAQEILDVFGFSSVITL